MKTKRILLIFTMLVVFVLMVSTASAALVTPPNHDTYVTISPASSAGQHDSEQILVVEDSLSTCNDTRIVYLRFQVDGIEAVTSAQLQLTPGGGPIFNTAGATLTLYDVADYNVATLSGSNYPSPASGTVIQSLTGPFTAGSAVTFSDANLATRLQVAADGDNVLTLALSFSAGCNPLGTSIVSFYSTEVSPANPSPILTVEGTSEPNAVAISTFTTDNAAPTWPLYAGLGALALIAAAAGVAWSRRRAALR